MAMYHPVRARILLGMDETIERPGALRRLAAGAFGFALLLLLAITAGTAPAGVTR
jgi:hypothetical protein